MTSKGLLRVRALSNPSFEFAKKIELLFRVGMATRYEVYLHLFFLTVILSESGLHVHVRKNLRALPIIVYIHTFRIKHILRKLFVATIFIDQRN